MKPIGDIAKTAGVAEEYLEYYGRYKAKIDYRLLNETQAPNGKLILVTAINPTPAGEGKTTTTVGLADALRRMGKNALVALREPSLGPVFGVKGGAAGGGYAQVCLLYTSCGRWCGGPWAPVSAVPCRGSTFVIDQTTGQIDPL